MFTGNWVCTSFKEEVLAGVHDFSTDTFKIALYTNAASIDYSTTAYSATNETSGTNYVAGGVALTGTSVTNSGPLLPGNGLTVMVTFTNPVFTNVTITFRGALIYNSSKANKAVAVLDFGSDKTYTAQDATIQLPPVNPTDALLRF